MSLSPAFLDELRARTSLSGLIAHKVKLTKAGREQKGCCPFHGEKTASFYVNDDKGFYHCFGCSAHGDAIRWLTDHEGLPFLDAVRELAAAAGLEMPANDPRHAERDREREEMLGLMDHAARIFTANLQSDDVGIPGREYLTARGIDPYGPFGLGWACGWRQGPTIVEQLGGKKGEHVDKLVKLGLARVHSEGERKGQAFDFFRGRVMFPIRDQRGRVIGFGGRVLGDQQPKYLNSPDTPVFDKGQTLFNIDRAGPAARTAKRLLVVEGYMDVIGLATAGIDEAVAPNGTALTEAQIARLWRLADVPIVCLDGDKAGRAAAARAAIRALPLLEPGKSLAFATPPDGQDPDDVARKGGRDAVEAMIVAPRPLAEVLWHHELDAEPVDTPEQIAGLKSRMREHVRSIRNADVREAYGNDIAARFRARFAVDPRAFGPRSSGPRRAPLRRTSTERQPFSQREQPQTRASKAIGRGAMAVNVERAIAAGLIRYPSVAKDVEMMVETRFNTETGRAIRHQATDWAMAGGFAEDWPGEHLSAEQIAWATSGPLRFSFTTDGADPETAHRDLVDALDQLRR